MVIVIMKSKYNNAIDYITAPTKDRAEYLFKKYYAMYYGVVCAVAGESFTIE